jgi:hypothetical protein
MHFFRIIETGAILALSTALCFGQDSSNIKITANGRAAMEFGQVVKGYDNSYGDIDHVTIDRIYLGTGLTAQLGQHTAFYGNIEVKAFNEFPRQVTSGFTRRYYYYFYLTQAELTRRFPGLFGINGLQTDVGGGYFPYKYNENARNLGEYLFRSTAYPQTLTTEFDFPFARVAGFYARNTYTSGINTIKFDLLAALNTEWMAIGDLNLSMVGSYNLARIFEIGAGVQFCSVVSADESATTPENLATQYLKGTDTVNYTFRGTKLMGRFSIDPKKFFPESAIFGDKDLILYGEAALLGLKNYPVALNAPIWYNSRLERIPLVLGLNFPTFKHLDVLSFEGEWWGNRYPNNMKGIVFEGIPLPFAASTKTIDSAAYKDDNLKWSVFGAKTFANRYRVSFQVASDHMRTFAWDWNRQDWEEALRGREMWYYMLKFGVMF